MPVKAYNAIVVFADLFIARKCLQISGKKEER